MPFPAPGDLPESEIEPRSPALQADALPSEPPGKQKVDLKLNGQKTKIMASGPITSWQIDGETMETMTDFIFLGSKMTADSDCSHEIKNTFPLEGKL